MSGRSPKSLAMLWVCFQMSLTGLLSHVPPRLTEGTMSFAVEVNEPRLVVHRSLNEHPKAFGEVLINRLKLRGGKPWCSFRFNINLEFPVLIFYFNYTFPRDNALERKQRGPWIGYRTGNQEICVLFPAQLLGNLGKSFHLCFCSHYFFVFSL